MKVNKVKSWDDVLEEFAYLWKTEDADWMAQRKVEWRQLAKDVYGGCPAMEKKIYAEYFVKGTNLRGENPLLPDRLAYIPPVTRFFLTPFDSSKSMRLFFDEPLNSARDKSQIMSKYAWALSDEVRDFPWFATCLHYFSQEIIGSEYKLLSVGDDQAGSGSIYSPNPTTWCSSYHHRAKDSLSGRGEFERACIELLDYFVSALKFVNKEEKVSMSAKKLVSLIDAADKALSSGSLEGDKLELAQLLKKREDEMRSNWESAEPFDVRFS